MRVVRGRAFLPVLLALLAFACSDPEASVEPQPPDDNWFAAPPTFNPPVASAPTARPREPLPRSAADVELGTNLAAVETKLGDIECHDNDAGFRVCKARAEKRDDVENLEVYLHEGEVMSLSYDAPLPADLWGYLQGLIERYGDPSLRGHNERDKKGRVHEVYGWKDDRTLLSIRFVWVETEGEPRKLVQTNVTIWDRDAYGRWEQEAKARAAQPTVAPTVPASAT